MVGWALIRGWKHSGNSSLTKLIRRCPILMAVNDKNSHPMEGIYHSIRVEHSHLFALACTNNIIVTSSMKMVAHLMWN